MNKRIVLLSTRKVENNVRKWRIGWKPIDNNLAVPQYGEEEYDTFAEAQKVTGKLYDSFPAHYFVDLVPESE